MFQGHKELKAELSDAFTAAYLSHKQKTQLSLGADAVLNRPGKRWTSNLRL